MKLKHIILVLLAFPVIAFSCIEDLGNYDYVSPEEVLPVTISGFNDTIVKLGEELKIEPIVENLDSETEYAYTWFAVRENTDGALPVRDTLSIEKNLSAMVKMQAGLTYDLYFKVTDVKRDITALKKVKLTVTATEVTTGWYILKYMDGKTDFDYLKADETEFIPNVLGNIAGAKVESEDGESSIVIGDQQLEGKPVKIYYQSGRFSYYGIDANGKPALITAKPALHVLSEKDVKTFDPVELNLHYDFDGQFQGPPDRVVQNGGVNASNDLFLMAGGNLYTVSNMTTQVGSSRFGYPITSSLSPNCKLHKDFVFSNYGILVFDTVTKSFFRTAAGSATMAKFNEPTAEQIQEGLPSLLNMDYDLEFIRNRVFSTGFAMGMFALMKKSSSNEYFLLYMEHALYDLSYPPASFHSMVVQTIRFRPVPSNSDMLTADTYHAPRSASCLYYGKNNVLSYYYDVTGDNRDFVIHTFGAEEKVSFITDPEAGKIHVTTNSPSGWKLYSFETIGQTPDIDENSKKEIASGEGEAYYVMKR